MSDAINQHKRMAMGQGMKKGGLVKPVSASPPKSGLKNSPIENVKRANGVPGMKKGGAC
jgi:hypothetical protein